MIAGRILFAAIALLWVAATVTVVRWDQRCVGPAEVCDR